MTLELTLEKVHAMVEKAIEEKGADYIYPNWGPSCTYVDRNKDTGDVTRGCIVGHIFIDALELDMVELSNSSVNGEPANQFLGRLVRDREIDLPHGDEGEEILDYLGALQQSQDAGKPWGIAHEKAKDGISWSSHYKQWNLHT